MSHILRAAVAVALVTMLCPDIAPAQTRVAPPPRADSRVEPKISSTSYSTNATALAQLIAGTGVTVANATYTGSTKSAGTFAGGAGSVGIGSGVMLSTGDIATAIGPNNDSSAGDDMAQPGDTALDNLVAPYFTQDAAVLEFDVVPAAATIGISFVFASEEYNEFVGSQYNDVIAIYVNGVNCANYNGLPVNVNSINNDSNASLYVDNTGGSRNTQFDGMTVVLQCVGAVTPHAANHVKIAIADTSDGIYDSAVFIGAGGVTSPGNGAPTTSTIVKAIEYYHAVFNHYFMTAIPLEIANLDTGALSKDWKRTGEAFNVYVSGFPNTAPVCRFFSTSFAPKSSHFYTPNVAECATVKKNPNWLFEAEVFNLALPAADGSCAAGTAPLYRLYNNGQGAAPNHRYTTSLTIRATMQGQGWIPEGNGVVGVIGCVPN
jgi:hypothetical protein